ncbi:MAG TPA: DUF3014 domain-containing protein [Pseudomonadales bacterium]|nr:DUF3014 domain-containing protein [Pseudomonadales bacterium]
MYAYEQDRPRTTPPRHRSSVATVVVLLLGIALAGGGLRYYLGHTSDGERQQLDALKSMVGKVALPAPATPPAKAEPAPPPAPAPVTARPAPSPAEPAPVADEEPLPGLDASDDAVQSALASLLPAKSQTLLSTLLVSDQLLRRFVAFTNNLAAGKLDHKSGPFKSIKGKFGVTPGKAPTMTEAGQSRYNVYVDLITAMDAHGCATLYKHFYPLLSAAFGELGEPGKFHAIFLRALQVLLDTPDLTQAPTLVAADKGLYKFADPKLEALPAAQKQLLRMGWENVSHLKIWLRQFRTAVQ